MYCTGRRAASEKRGKWEWKRVKEKRPQRERDDKSRTTVRKRCDRSIESDQEKWIYDNITLSQQYNLKIRSKNSQTHTHTDTHIDLRCAWLPNRCKYHLHVCLLWTRNKYMKCMAQTISPSLYSYLLSTECDQFTSQRVLTRNKYVDHILHAPNRISYSTIYDIHTLGSIPKNLKTFLK